MLIENAKRLPHYSHIKDDSRFEGTPQVLPEIEPENDSITKLIFAPDPVTGIPSSDLGMLMSREAQPEVSKYIHDVLQRPIGVSQGLPDADTALQMSREYGETYEAYANRLRSICTPKRKQEPKNQ